VEIGLAITGQVLRGDGSRRVIRIYPDSDDTWYRIGSVHHLNSSIYCSSHLYQPHKPMEPIIRACTTVDSEPPRIEEMPVRPEIIVAYSGSVSSSRRESPKKFEPQSLTESQSRTLTLPSSSPRLVSSSLRYSLTLSSAGSTSSSSTLSGKGTVTSSFPSSPSSSSYSQDAAADPARDEVMSSSSPTQTHREK
jgi:hypothetical protein